MKTLIFIAIYFLALNLQANTNSAFQLLPEKTNSLSAGNAQFEFQILNVKSKSTLDAKSLVKTHTKLLHLIVYDTSLTEFQHVHPNYKNKKWTTELNFTFGGTYYVWAQGKTKSGDEFSSMTKIEVTGGSPAKTFKSLGEVRKNSDRHTQVRLDDDKLKTDEMVMLNFTVTREDGKSVKLKNYLGAFAHVIAVSPKENELIHVHPMAGEKPNQGMIHATFLASGEYRIWIQLDESNDVKTIPLSVQVN